MRPAGRAVFVTHGGAKIGLGHVKRCLALAQALAGDSAEVTFVVSSDPDVAKFIAGEGFAVVQHAWEREPSILGAAVGERAETVIVDAYTARTKHFEALRRRASQLVAIDDTAERRLPVDVVVNGGAGTENLEYKEVAAGTTLLLGSRYALLDPAYAHAPARPARAQIRRVLVTLGGSVHVGALQAAVAAVDAALSGVRVDVAIGPFGSPGILDGAISAGRNQVVPYGIMPDLRPLMLEADLAVSGAGVTLYELAATATPSVMVMTAPNQQRNVTAFDRAGAALSAGRVSEPGLPARLRAALSRLAGDPALRASLGAAGRGLVDGGGARRVAEALTALPSARR